MLSTYLISTLLMHKMARLRNLKENLHQKLFWTVPLRYLVEGYFELSICAVIGFISMQWDFLTPSIIVSNVVAITLTVILIFFPLILICLYPCNYKKLESETYKGKFGEMY